MNFAEREGIARNNATLTVAVLSAVVISTFINDVCMDTTKTTIVLNSTVLPVSVC